MKLGQQKPLWSQEWSTSSNALITFERSLLVNQLRPRQSLGGYASGKLGAWAYGVGWFEGDIDGNTDDEGRRFFIASVARDFKDWFDVLEDARWRIDYQYRDKNEPFAPGEFEHAISTSVAGNDGWTILGGVRMSF